MILHFIGFNDKTTTPGARDHQCSAQSETDDDESVIRRWRGGVSVRLTSSYCDTCGWDNVNVFIMSRDTTIAWWRTIKFSLTFIRSVSICSGLTTISPLIWYSYRPRSTDNEWYLIKSVRELPLHSCSTAWSALQCNAARVSDQSVARQYRW